MSASGERGLRMRLVAAARRLAASGVNPATSGNLSARAGEGFLVTPSGLAYDALGPEDLVYMEHDWTHGSGTRAPSTEWRMHRDAYASRPEVHAVVHTHGPYATTLACLRRGIPAFHYEVAFAGGDDIRCARYATFGTQELSNAALEALEGRSACLLANHGALALGAGIEAATALAERVEALARLYWQALQVGEPALLDREEMARVVAKFSTYGR